MNLRKLYNFCVRRYSTEKNEFSQITSVTNKTRRALDNSPFTLSDRYLLGRTGHDLTAGWKLLREKCRAGPQSYCLVKCFAFNLCSIVTLSLHVSKKILPPK